MTSPGLPLHWNKYRYVGVDRVTFTKHVVMNIPLSIEYGEGPVFQYNLHISQEGLKNSSNIRPFILTSQEINDWLDGPGPFPQLENLTSFVKFHPSKSLFLRTFSSVCIERDQNRRVFTDDVLEILSIILERIEEERNEEKMKKMEEYREKWKISEGYSTIGLKELMEVLETLGIDDKLITLVPDVEYVVNSTTDFPIFHGNVRLTVKSPDNKPSLSQSQAIFFIFKEIVSNINLSNPSSSKKLEIFKNIIILKMREIASLKEGTYLTEESVETTVNWLENRCSSVLNDPMNGLTPPKFFGGCDFTDKTTVRFFVEFARQFNVPGFEAPGVHSVRRLDESMFYCWKANAIMLREWASMFFGSEENQDLKILVEQAIFHLIPLMKWTGSDDFMDVILMKTEAKQSIVWNTSLMSCQGVLLLPMMKYWARVPRFPNKNRPILLCEKWIYRYKLMEMIREDKQLEPVEKYMSEVAKTLEKKMKSVKNVNLEEEKQAAKTLAAVWSARQLHVVLQNPEFDEFRTKGHDKDLEMSLRRMIL